jgi:hypothetical protein
MRGTTRLAFVCVVLVLGAQAIVLSADWTSYFPDGCALLFTTTPAQLGPDGQPVWSATISAWRGPIVAGFCDIQATVSSPGGDLQRVQILVGDDLNSDGILAPAEWTVTGSALAVPDGQGGTVATLLATSVSATHAGYRVAHFWAWGQSFDQFVDVGLN